MLEDRFPSSLVTHLPEGASFEGQLEDEREDIFVLEHKIWRAAGNGGLRAGGVGSTGPI